MSNLSITGDTTTTTNTTTTSGTDKSTINSNLSIGSDAITGKSNTDTSIDFDSVRGKPSACVFVASLYSSKTDDELSISVTNHFEKWGKLSTVKVLRDTSNRPYAFVQYCNDEDCKRAIENGHNSTLDGRVIRCEAAKVNRTLFIQTHHIILESLIKTQLSKFGEIEQLVSSDKSGNSNINSTSSKFWYCKFSFRDDAIKAFASLTEENKYEVDWTQNIDGNRYRNERKIDKFSVFVGQLTPDIEEPDLRKRFERHGKIENIQIVRKEKTSFAFIKFETESGAAGAVERENHSMFNGKTIHIQYREWQYSSKVSTNPWGVPLAPPPISLNRNLKYEHPKFRGDSRYHQGALMKKYFDRRSYNPTSEFHENNFESRKHYASREYKPYWSHLRRKERDYYDSDKRERLYFSRKHSTYDVPRNKPYPRANFYYFPGDEGCRETSYYNAYYEPVYPSANYDDKSIEEVPE